MHHILNLNQIFVSLKGLNLSWSQRSFLGIFCVCAAFYFSYKNTWLSLLPSQCLQKGTRNFFSTMVCVCDSRDVGFLNNCLALFASCLFWYWVSLNQVYIIVELFESECFINQSPFEFRLIRRQSLDSNIVPYIYFEYLTLRNSTV